MVPPWWPDWLNWTAPRRRRPWRSRKFACQLRLESLEERLLLATRTWTGAGADNNWTTAANWGGTAPVANDDLVFAGSLRTSNANNFAANTAFRSITFAAAGFSLSGNAIKIGKGGGGGTSLITVNAGVAGTNTISFDINDSNRNTRFSATDAAATLVLSGILSGNKTITIAGNGTVQFTGASANTYSAATTVNAGATLLVAKDAGLGTTAAGTTVTAGGTLAFQGNITYGTAETVTINGTGVGGVGALNNLSGANSFAGAISLGSASTIGTTAGSLTLSGVISGGQNLTKSGPGTLVFAGGSANTYSGTTTVNGGTLTLSKTAGNAIAGNLTIGDSLGGPNSDLVQLTGSNQILDTATVTINSSGLLDLNNQSDTIGPLTLSAGNVTTGTGTLTLGGNVTGLTGSSSATISGNLALGSATRTFTIASGAATDNLIISAVISGGVGLTKAGLGKLTLSGTSANTYTGTTTVSAGILNVQKTGALGTTAGGTSVSSGAALEVQGSLGIGTEALTLNGTGISGAGALHSLSGTNSWAGAVALAGTSSIGVDAGQLTLSGVVSGTGFGLNKEGAGTLVLSNTNTYSGTTSLDAGTLLVNGTQASSAISLNGGTLGGSGTTGVLTATAIGGTVSPGTAGPGILNTGNVALNSASIFTVQLNGTTAGSGYDQLNVTGTVNLASAALNASVGFASAVGDTFTLINNDGSDVGVGTFSGLPEGALFTIGGIPFKISYLGGTGNDVVLTRINPFGNPPTLTSLNLSASTINENGSVILSGTFTDPDAGDSHTVVIDWGDGGPTTTIFTPAGTFTFSATHQYLDDVGAGISTVCTINAVLTDSGGNSVSGTKSVTVNNVAPSGVTLGLSGNPIDEGDTVTLTGSFSDPGTLDAHAVVIDWGDGGPTTTLNLGTGVLAFSANHLYLDDAGAGNTTPYAITATVTDNDGASGSGSTIITVNNVVPSGLSVSVSATPIIEGDTIGLTGSFSDPGTLDTHAVVIDWGDGSPTTTVSLAAGILVFNAPHTYLDNTGAGTSSVNTINVTVTDKDGDSGSGSTTVTVNNAAPSALNLTLSADPINEGDTVTLTGAFDDPGTLDTQVVVIDWGDSGPTTTLNLGAGALTFSPSHPYDAGASTSTTYTINVTVTDNDGSSTSASTSVTVNNVAPTVTINGPTSGVAGITIYLTSTLVDPGINDTFTYAWTITRSRDGGNTFQAFATGTSANFALYPDNDGLYHVTLTATDKDGAVSPTASQDITVVVNATHLAVAVSSPETAGTAAVVTVTAQDFLNNLATTYRGTVHFTSSDGQALLPGDYTFTAGDNGVHTFTGAAGVTFQTAGNQTLTATDMVVSSIAGTSNASTVAAAAATHYTLSVPAATSAGTSFSFTIRAQDSFGNTATGYRGTVHFATSDSQAVLPGECTFTAGDNGVHTFTAGATFKTAGIQSLGATDTTDASITGFTGSVVSAASAIVLAISSPNSATAGTPFNVTVTTRDNYGNTATTYRGTVHFTSSDGQALLPGDYTFTAGDNGVHTFSGAAGATFKTAGIQTLTATDTITSSITGTSNAITTAALPLQVTSFTPTNTGFVITFNEAFDPSVLNLYDSATAGYGPADVTLVGNTVGNVKGSLLFNATNTGLTFIKTGGILANDTYTVSLRGTNVGVSFVPVSAGGSGYVSAPTVSFSGGGGTGATATSSLSVTSIVLNTGGSGYTSAPTVTFAAPPSGTTATGTAVLTGGVVTSVTITNPGSGYTAMPTVTFTGGGFTSPANGSARGFVTSIVLTSPVTSVTVTAGGSGYTSTPTVTFTAPPSGTTATGTAIFSGGTVTGINITNPGSGYTSAPNINFSGGGGSGAQATAVLTLGGNFYTSPPTVSLSGGGGSGATATAMLGYGFQDVNHTLLDGNGILVNQANGSRTATFSYANTAVVVSVPDFARGPDGSHNINIPVNSTSGVPITLSNGAGLTSATFTLQYDATRLTITGASVNTSLAGATFSLSGASTSGNAILNFSS